MLENLPSILVVLGVCVQIDSLDDLRRNDLARTAPGSEAVKNHQAGLVAERLVEGRLAAMLLAVARRDNDVAHAGKTLRYCAIVTMGGSRLEVVYAGVRHSGCVGEELLCEKRSV